jgi:hypothetical protein
MQRAVLVAVVFASSVAAAAPRTAQLDATGACDLGELEPRASELLGRPAIAADAAARVEVVVVREGDVLAATLTFTDENGTAQPARTMTAASCEELIEPIAIVISLVLREEPPPAPEPPAPPPPPAPTPLVEHHDTLFTPEPPPIRARALELGAAISSARHSTLVVGGRLERRRTALAADLEVSLPEQVDVSQGAVHVTSARANAAGCLRLRGVWACGLVGAGLVRARGDDLMDARTAIRPLASLGVRAEWRQPLSRHLGLRLFATADQVLVRPSFLVDNTAVWTAPLLQVWLGGGIFLQMP